MFEKNISKKLSSVTLKAVRSLEDIGSGMCLPEGFEVIIQSTKDKSHGDYSTTVAMRLASAFKKNPAIIAEEIKNGIEKELESSSIASSISKIGIKGAFINFFLSEEYYTGLLRMIRDEGDDYGKSALEETVKVNIEYVSANPTGPLTIAHGRQAAIGDALSRILKFTGHDVTREYYLNDCGRQIALLGKSVETRYKNLFGKEEAMPEDGYMGDYICEIAEKIKSEIGDKYLNGDEDDFFRTYSVEWMMRLIKKDLADFRVDFDVWTSQKGIEKRRDVETILKKMKEDGYLYEKDGALWFKSSDLGDDKDRVLVKSDGAYTYLAPDIAYHRDKYKRGFDKLIDLLGPDHHGYIKRMKAAVQTFGKSPDSLNILIVQLVTLLREGEAIQMSTRRGEFISLREIIDEIGTDVARFFFLMRKLDSHLDFDIELAKKESMDNPVFYIQYAHARICSINRFYDEKEEGDIGVTGANLGLLRHESEKNVIKILDDFGNAVKTSARDLEPSKVITYLNELASEFHSFYTNCRVVSDDSELTKARLFLVECVRIVLKNGLNLLNISFPEKM